MGFLFPLLVWDMPSSSTCGNGPAHLENSKIGRFLKKLYIIMHFFGGFLVFCIFFISIYIF